MAIFSRSNSRSSRGSNEDDIVRDIEDLDLQDDPQIEEFRDMNLPRSIPQDGQDPLNSILSLLTEKINEIVEVKGKNKIGQIDLPTIQQLYLQKNETDKEYLDEQFKLSTESAQDRILSSQLRGFTVNPLVEAPTNFSPVPVLTTPSRSRDLLGLFPRKPFRGQNKDSEVLEWLGAFQIAQKAANLSKEEFLQTMLLRSTGSPHRILKNLIDGEESVNTIYFKLTSIFDFGPTPADARQKLHGYVATRDQTLIELHQTILDLSQNASRLFAPGPSRRDYADNIACISLMQSLPRRGNGINAQELANQEYFILSSKLQKPPTFSQYFGALYPYSKQIDEALKYYGATKNHKDSYELKTDRIKPNRLRSHISRNFTPRVFNNNINTQGQFNKHTQGQFNKPYQSNYRTPGYRSNNYKNNNGYNNSNFNRNYNNNQRQYNKPNRFQKRKCLLCLGDHSPVNCPKMEKNGVIQQVSPTVEPCSICLSKKNIRVFHPSTHCFNKNS